MRIVSLSVDGIHQAAQRGLYEWLDTQDADIICLQDLRALEYELDHPIFHPDGYFTYIFDSGVAHHNGVAIYTRQQPKALIFGMGFANGADMDGRYLQADFERLSVGSLMAPPAKTEAELEAKVKFFEDMQAHLHKISRKRRDFIFCGDWGMAHRRADVQNWQDHEDSPGFMRHEQRWMEQLFTEIGYVDAFRKVVKDSDEFSWWPSGTVGEGDGWRTDMQVISESLKGRVEYGAINKNALFSSHLPLTMDYDIEI
ncbi:exodeoxyribonuclease III [Biformimicrobium ophioploci]|uniref:Exodeoxyribonuclease III n=1 Tax=Biformimicrobium ophioploci TaxID=3036711 RepID=A0ABQ6LVP4_9GAMM|nr:exodeoxyribonuclease III [Microbulbifer sp. NKW57]GMG86163.1 exodeoxyribonuclease III [Microbulbifer sp. NKW57]